MSTLSTHILDTSVGRPAEGVGVELFAKKGETWENIGGGTTNDDGRIKDLIRGGNTLEMGIYRIEFATGDYYAAKGQKGFYPHVSITFDIQAPDEHYHVPLLLNPYGFSTYRGS